MALLTGRRARLTALSCLLLFLTMSGAGLAARHVRKQRHKRAPSAAVLQKQLRSLSAKKRQTQQRLRETKAKQREVIQRLTRIDQKLDVTESRLQVVSQEHHDARVGLRVAASQLREAKDELNNRRDVVADRLVAVYEQGDSTPLQVMLQAQSFADFSDRLYFLNRIAQQDVQILEELDAAKVKAADKQREVARREQNLSDLKQAVEVQKGIVVAQREQTRQEKLAVTKDRLALEQALYEMQAQSEQITVFLRRLQRTSRARGGVVVTPWHGSLGRPVAGRITSSFGYRMHPILGRRIMHTGVDIAAPSGTPIHAAAAGVVLSASRRGGYGNCIIIDHGGGLATLYGHCSGFAVRAGQKVSQGQIIGYVGSTGLSTGPHCHFEVRRNGTPVNPL